jgi:hypothetical protein
LTVTSLAAFDLPRQDAHDHNQDRVSGSTYLGIFTSLAYFFAVSLSFPEKERALGPVQPPRAPQAPQVVCPKCKGNRWFTCEVCGGRMSITAPSVEHCSCRAGHVDCGVCHATGVVPASRVSG